MSDEQKPKLVIEKFGPSTTQAAADGNVVQLAGRHEQLTGPALFDSLFESMDAFMERAKNLPEPSWLLPEVVPAAGQIWVLGAPGVGKTWFVLGLARLAADSGRFVLLIEEEGGARALSDRLEMFDFPEEARKRVMIAHRRNIKLANTEFRQALIQHIKSLGKPPVVIIDPATAVFTGNENDTQEAGLFRDQLGEIVQAFDDTLVLILHHSSKEAERSQALVYVGRGSTTWTGGADMEIVLRRPDEPQQKGIHKFEAHVGKPPRDFPEPPAREVTVVLGTGELQLCLLKNSEDQTKPKSGEEKPPVAVSRFK